MIQDLKYALQQGVHIPEKNLMQMIDSLRRISYREIELSTLLLDRVNKTYPMLLAN